MSSPRALEILDRLIAFPTVSRDSNLDLIAYARDLLSEIGAAVRIVHSADGAKANLHAVLGPAEARGILLSGHTDVVPADGDGWTSDPFRLAIRGDRLFGRGTADMKGFIACVLAVAEEAAALRLVRPLQMAFSYDEEIGCVGVRRLLDVLAGTANLPTMCIVGEPTFLETVVAHKGKTAGRVICRGKECHSSHAPEGMNAIHLAAEMVDVFRAMQDRIVAAGRNDPDYAIPFTTVHVGLIRGGSALNVVPRECTLDFEIRNLPADDPAVLLDDLFNEAASLTRRVEQDYPGTGVSLEIVNAYPGLETDRGEEVVRLAGRLTGASGLRKIAFGTEGGLFHERLGIPTVVCGPGDIRDAHKPDEFVSRDQLDQCTTMLRRLVGELAA
jgi:acetylornithine deacetylase